MSTEALRKAVEEVDLRFTSGNSVPVERAAIRDHEWQTIRQALRDQEAEIARLREQAAMSMGVGTGDGQLFVHGSYDSIKAAQAIVLRAEQAESALATHRANYDALVIRLGEVTARLEAADGLLREAEAELRGVCLSRESDRISQDIRAHLGADHV